jgi:hypothetical protein
VNLYRRVAAMHDSSSPGETSFDEEIRTVLQQTPPFQDSGEAQICDGRDRPRTVPCPHRAALMEAIIEALTAHGTYCVGFVHGLEQWATHEVPKALDLIEHVLHAFYPRRRKLHRQYARIAEAVQAIGRADYAKQRKTLQRRVEQSKRQLTRLLYEAFLQYGPSPTDYPREAIYWAIATILTACGLEAGEIIHITDRIRKRLPQARPSAE